MEAYCNINCMFLLQQKTEDNMKQYRVNVQYPRFVCAVQSRRSDKSVPVFRQVFRVDIQRCSNEYYALND
jgi:hypothetical protein